MGILLEGGVSDTIHSWKPIILQDAEDILQFANDSARCRMMNSDNILHFAEFIENLSFFVNPAFCKIMVESYIQIGF